MSQGPQSLDSKYSLHGNQRCIKKVGICVIQTPRIDITGYVEIVLPYWGTNFVYDESLAHRSIYLPSDLKFAVKIYDDQYLYVKSCCNTNSCSCIYYLDGIPSQIKPCRVAAMMYRCNMFTNDDLFVLTGLCRGFKIIDTDVELSYSVQNYNSITKGPMYTQMCKNIGDELIQGKVSVTDKKARCVHALGAVARPDGRLRPITDCSRPYDSVNDHMLTTASRFKFSHVENVRPMVQYNGYGGVVDLSNAYRSILIFPPHRSYMGFQWEFGGKTVNFSDNALCFGLRSAPSIFNEVSIFVKRYMARIGIDCLCYLDDYFVAGPDYLACREKQELLVSTLVGMGFEVNSRKVINPCQAPRYLGVVIDLISLKFRLPEEKILKATALVDDTLSHTWVSRKSLERVTGTLAHCSTLVKGGRTFCRRLYSLLKNTRDKKRVRLSPLYRLDLQWWSKFLRVFDGLCDIFPETVPSAHVFTDASNTGFGAWCQDNYLFGFWGDHNYACGHIYPSPVFDDLSVSNINVKELWPVLAAVKKWGEGWRNSYVLLFSDNTQVLSMISSGRSRNPIAMGLLRELFWCCSINKIDLRATYINTGDNVFADKLSRLPSDVCKINAFGLPLKFSVCCSQGP